MEKRKMAIEFPKAFLDFWENADEETRMMAACVGYSHALKTIDNFLSCLLGFDD